MRPSDRARTGALDPGRRRILECAAWLAAVASLWCGAAAAHGPMPQRVNERVELAAPPDVVWRRIGDFADVAWHPGVASTQADHGNEPGSVRTVRLREGGQLVETLKRRSDADRSLTYALDDAGPLPVSDLRATLTVQPAGGSGSVVEWSASFLRADRSPRPAAGQDDAAAVAAVAEVFRAGLAALRGAEPPP